MEEEREEALISGQLDLSNPDIVKPRKIDPTPDYGEYYVKHASALETPDDLKLVLANIQTYDSMSNNVSLWMNWKFAKQLGIYLFLRVLKHEESFGQIDLKDEIALKNLREVLTIIKKYSIEDIDNEISTIMENITRLQLHCNNTDCGKEYSIKLPKDKFPQNLKKIDINCVYCGSIIHVDLDSKKDSQIDDDN